MIIYTPVPENVAIGRKYVICIHLLFSHQKVSLFDKNIKDIYI